MMDGLTAVWAARGQVARTERQASTAQGRKKGMENPCRSGMGNKNLEEERCAGALAFGQWF
jgi:hypothetical protein